MTHIAVVDESGTHAGCPCYTIGGFVVPEGEFEEITTALSALRSEYGVDDELKWTKIGSYNARTELAFEGVRHLFESGATFQALVTEKSTFRKWQSNHEEAFYHSYFQLARNLARGGNDIRLMIDERSDQYDKRAEVLEIVTNRALVKEQVGATIGSVEMIDSRSQEILQFSDVLVGAINSDTARYLDERVEMNRFKEELVRRLARLVGWDRFWYDTWPNQTFNVWHFPTNFRARPKTLDPVVDLTFGGASA